MVTAVPKEIPYCPPEFHQESKKGTLYKPAIISQEKTPATIEADQILLAPQQLVTKSNPANFNNNTNRIPKMPKSLATTMPAFGGKIGEIGTVWTSLANSLKIHNQLIEKDKNNYLHSLMRGDALQTFKNITSPNRKNLGEILTVIRKKTRGTSVNCYSETQVSLTGLQSGKPEVNWFSRRNPETSEGCIRSCRSSNHWAIHLCQNASPPEENNQPVAFWEWHIWRVCVASW